MCRPNHADIQELGQSESYDKEQMQDSWPPLGKELENQRSR
jgi:hypothetical protein